MGDLNRKQRVRADKKMEKKDMLINLLWVL